MIAVFEDSDLRVLVTDRVLIEGKTYYLNVSNISEKLIQDWLKEEYISGSITHYHPKNPILSLRFENIVGLVNILGLTFDVRSSKLEDSKSGNDQFISLLNDIETIYSQLTFTFKATAASLKENDYSFSNNDLQIFNYYYQLVFKNSPSNNLNALLNQCLNNPNVGSIAQVALKPLEKVKRIDPSFFTHLGKMQTFVKLNPANKLAKTSFGRTMKERTGELLFPAKVISKEYVSTINTKENQFLKFFLNEIMLLALKISTTSKDSFITDKSKRLEEQVKKYLRNPFFSHIGKLTFLPSSSSVLLNKSGYRDIYYHFIQSKFNFRSIIDELNSKRHSAGLKNIAHLYEMWVFFKVAIQVFGKESIAQSFNGRIVKHGEITGSYTLEGKEIKVHYNKSYSLANKGSYSVTLRPDVVIEIKDKHFLFDAKYKVNDIGTSDESLLKIVKQEDIHKMHTYLDAISKAESSIVIYPGTEFVFYSVDGTKSITPINIAEFKGVGAIPLIPRINENSLELILKEILI